MWWAGCQARQQMRRGSCLPLPCSNTTWRQVRKSPVCYHKSFLMLCRQARNACSVVHLCLTLCNPADTAQQALLSGLPCPPPGNLPNPGIEPASLISLALAGRFLTTESPGKPSKALRPYLKLEMKLLWGLGMQ